MTYVHLDVLEGRRLLTGRSRIAVGVQLTAHGGFHEQIARPADRAVVILDAILDFEPRSLLRSEHHG